MSKSIRIRLAVFAVTLTAGLSACNLSQTAGTLGQLQSIAQTCPRKALVGSYVDDVVDGNSRGAALTAERLADVKQVVTFTAVCGGELQVVASSSSAAGVQTLYSGELKLAGATENSRLRQVPSLVDSVMRSVKEALPAATAQLQSGATDDLGQLTLMQQYISGLGAGYKLYGELLTTGMQTVGVALINVRLSAAAAADLGEHVPVPALPGADLTIAGLGTVASGTPAPTSYVTSLVEFYSKVCDRTGAQACHVTIDPSTIGS